MNKRRKQLMIELERIIGNEFYNAKIQNWGPGGVFEGEGRGFRYPIVFKDKDGNASKTWGVDPAIPADTLMTGSYKLGSNELSVMRAVDEIIKYFENYYGVDPGKAKK